MKDHSIQLNLTFDDMALQRAPPQEQPGFEHAPGPEGSLMQAPAQ